MGGGTGLVEMFQMALLLFKENAYAKIILKSK